MASEPKCDCSVEMGIDYVRHQSWCATVRAALPVPQEPLRDALRLADKLERMVSDDHAPGCDIERDCLAAAECLRALATRPAEQPEVREAQIAQSGEPSKDATLTVALATRPLGGQRQEWGTEAIRLLRYVLETNDDTEAREFLSQYDAAPSPVPDVQQEPKT